MKSADKAAIFTVPAGLLLVAGVFAHALGLSEMTGLVLFLAALILMLLGYRRIIKAGQNH